MRSMWSGSLGFGLVNVPIKLYKAHASHDVSFKQHHGPDCLGAVGYVKVCKECEDKVEYTDIVKGIEVEGQVVVVTEDELVGLADEQGKQIEILQFVEATEIDPSMFESAYYIGTVSGEKGYALLVNTMASSGLVAIARFMMRSKTTMAAVRVVDGVLVLHTLMWPDEIRAADVPGLGGDFSAAELKAATALVESMVGKFNPDEYRDTYTDRVRELIAAKSGDLEFVTGPAVKAAAEEDVSDLLAMLEASVQRHPAGKKPAAAKKAPARTAAPRKRKVA